MVYPPEGLFYIEMDQSPPGKLGLKSAIVWSAGGSGNLLFAFLLLLFISCNIMSVMKLSCEGGKAVQVSFRRF